MSALSIAILVIVITVGVVLFFFFGGLGLLAVYTMRLGPSNEKERAQREKAASRARIAGTTPIVPEPKKDGGGKDGWLTKLRNSKFARAFYIIAGWWILVLVPLAFGLKTIPHFLLVDQIWATVTTPIFACACAYYLGKDAPKIMKGIAIAVIIAMVSIWLYFIGNAMFTSESWKDWRNRQNNSARAPVVREPTYRLIERFDITSDAWKTFDLPTGRSRVKVLGPTEVQTFYRNEYRETLRFEGGNHVSGNGPTDQLRLRALRPGETVTVEIYEIQ